MPRHDSAICSSSLLVLALLFVVKIIMQCVIKVELCWLLLTLSSQVKCNRPNILSLLVSENETQAAVGSCASIRITSPHSNYCRGGSYTLKRLSPYSLCPLCYLKQQTGEKKSFISSCLPKDLVLTRWIKVPPRSKLARYSLKTACLLPPFTMVENSSNVC